MEATKRGPSGRLRRYHQFTAQGLSYDAHGTTKVFLPRAKHADTKSSDVSGDEYGSILSDWFQNVLGNSQLDKNGGDESVDKDYVDAKIEASEARTRELVGGIRSDIDRQYHDLKSSISHLPSSLQLWAGIFTAVISIVGLVYVLIQSSWDRFDSGLAAGPAFEERISRMEERLGNKIDSQISSLAVSIKHEPQSNEDAKESEKSAGE